LNCDGKSGSRQAIADNMHTAAMMNDKMANADDIGWFGQSAAKQMMATTLNPKRRNTVPEP
jgi:hypothetical protein